MSKIHFYSWNLLGIILGGGIKGVWPSKSLEELKICGFSLSLPDALRSMAGMKSSVPLSNEVGGETPVCFLFFFMAAKVNMTFAGIVKLPIFGGNKKILQAYMVMLKGIST